MKILSLSLFINFFLFQLAFGNSDEFALINSKDFKNLKVKVARDYLTKEKGLMGLKELEGYNGMLFLYKKENIVNIWMKDTFIPLDIIFIDKKKKISSIREGIPNSRNLISSNQKVIAVLEIPKGCSHKLKIKKGKTINWVFNSFFEKKNIEYYHCLQ